MKTGKSLNVNAAVYVPLSQRGTTGDNQEHLVTATGSESSKAAVGVTSHPANTAVNYHPSRPSPNYLNQFVPPNYQNQFAPPNYQNQFAPPNYHNYSNPPPEAYTWKRSDHQGSYASSSKSPKAVTQKDLDEDFEMDLVYLQMNFPDFSDESLSHIYLANGGDLETTVEMLEQLAVFTDEAEVELLPDTLDIGDTSESQSFEEGTSLKLKEVADEIPGSLVSSSNQHPVEN